MNRPHRFWYWIKWHRDLVPYWLWYLALNKIDNWVTMKDVVRRSEDDYPKG